jgi:GTPase involved in cell partitioning and DNA repair
MSSIRKHSRLLLVAVCCVALGAGVSAIASAGAATGGAGKVSAATKRTRAVGLKRLAARAVSGDVVVHTKAGFTTVSFQRGKVDSVSGQQLTITEGTAQASYKTVTVTIPANARVRDDRQKATLSDVKAGQRVLVLNGRQQTVVIARTPRAG